MKFLVLNCLTAFAALLLIHTLGEPLMTDGARWPLTGVVGLLAVLTPVLERWLRPTERGSVEGQVRKVMVTTLVKMFAMLILILVYLSLDAPDPRVFGMASYLVYAAFTGLLVAETMRHRAPH